DLNGVSLLYGRHVRFLSTMNSRFPSSPAAATRGGRGASFGTLGKGPVGLARAAGQGPGRRAWTRFRTSPPAPAATSTRASAPSTISGTGTEDGLDGLSCWATPGRPPSGLRP